SRSAEFLSESAPPSSSARLSTFGEWRQAKEQINTLGILPRDQGVFMKMDKKSISAVANKIFDSQNTEFLVVGKVGCGKSTKFVHALMQTGKVLLCEPTRALVTNVEEGINKVCGVDPSVRMRFYNKFGSHPVTIMTYGFALNWFANGCENVTDYQYIVMDECHKVESDFIVFYNWLRVRAPQIKVIKLSATPVNHITAYEPECSVNVIEQASCSIKAFAEAQGRNSAMDATKYGRIILVFVASYNDVDTATEVLRHKGFGVVKADRRQLRNTPNLSDKISEMQQQFVFVVATNAIENGVTLDVDVVVDFGEKIVGTLDSAYRHIGTRRVKISAGERIQRLGRVGRFKPGTAIRMGLLDKASDAIDELTATEAALKSFVFNVPPCLINVDTELIDQITRPQATTASMFELDLVYFSHFIRQDGKIPKAIYHEFRHLMLRDTKLEIIDKYSTSVASRGWKTVGFYSVSGHTRLDEHHNTFIPFHSHIISDEALSRIAQAMKDSDPGRGRGFALPADQLYQAVYKISYEQDKIGSILNVIEGLRQREQEKLDSLRTSTSILTSQSLLNILNCRFLANKEKLEQQYLTSLTTLNNVEQTLRSIPSGSSDETILEYLRENPMTAQCVLFE
nr:CI [Rose yellow mosaic virus]